MRSAIIGLTLCLLCTGKTPQVSHPVHPKKETRTIVQQISIRNQAITPVTVRFVERAIREAERPGVECLVIALDTPGGLLSSTEQIVEDILNSPVPIIIFVYPPSGRAASAGVFITLAGHVAAMAPGTRIGAAHPVQITGLPLGPQENNLSPIRQKIVNDTRAWARGLAELRGRNAEWAERTVTESLSITATEAVKDGAVDLLAADLTDLLRKIDGRRVIVRPGTAQQRTIQLRTAEASVHTINMWWGERLLGIISTPNIAFLLLLFGVYGILYELYSPGWGVSGTLGVVSMVLGFFGLSVLPINYAGLALIIVAFALFAAEAFVTSYGTLAIGGMVCLILGGTMLVDSPTGFMRISLKLLIPVAIATGLIVVFLVSRVVRAQRSRVQTGGESLLGLQGVADEDFIAHGNEFAGQILIHGERWQARSSTLITAGQMVKIMDRHGLTLTVGS